ncbi:MAG TPA: dihydrodipicolinate reductase C-terminal domain-containing protein [bacterium]|jgi:4-hydroxy-tetrahydrodipicolinate reductase
MSEPAGIALFGAAGKMGREILRQAWRHDELRIAYAYDTKHAGEVVESTTVLALPPALPEDVRLVMDFSAAAAVQDHLDLALNQRAAYLTGVTGLPQDVLNELRAAANEIAVLHSPNMAAGMHVMFKIAALTAKALPNYERHILEIHHTEKKDAPSGTALGLAHAVRDAVEETTPITSLRMGDVTGEHRITFGGPGERIEIIHRADSRAVFAVGALRAASWLLHKSPGFYGMGDVLEL